MVLADHDRMHGYVRGPLPENHDNDIHLLFTGVHVHLWPAARTRLQKASSIIKHLLQYCTDRVVKGVCAQDETSVQIHFMQTNCE